MVFNAHVIYPACCELRAENLLEKVQIFNRQKKIK
jgi:hypothetical protein